MVKHKIQITSLKAYADVLETLGDRQIQVYKAIKDLRSANNLMIAERVGLPINSVTPRVKELRDLGVVRAHHKAYCPKTQRLTIFWKPRIWDF